MGNNEGKSSLEKALPYDFAAIERKWQKRWKAAGCFRADDSLTMPRFYNFDGGPFPNGPLHMGHVRTFTLGDVMARYQRMRGKNVLYCFEFDAFGLPNELAAQESGISPEELTQSNIRLIRRQMRRLGLSYDWRYVHVTCDPRYYRWTQWLFLQLYKRGLIYRAPAALNWCPQCETTLAHMQVIQGRCWRCDTMVERQTLTQWFVRLSKYSSSLFETLSNLQGWSPRVRHLLKGFMGGCEGLAIDFPLVGQPGKTLTAFAKYDHFAQGAAYLAAAVGHPFIEELVQRSSHQQAVQAFIQKAKSYPASLRRRRTAKGGQELYSSGINTGLLVKNPLTAAEIPVFIAGYVDPSFATGIEIGNPNVSERDMQFAHLHRIPFPNSESVSSSMQQSSDVTEGAVRQVTYYRVRDWLVSRQRSWGTPIPIVYCATCGEVPIPEEGLPVLVPSWDKAADSNGKYSLGSCSEFLHTNCPQCGRSAQRETDTLDCYFDVIWCFLACSTQLDARFRFSPDDFKSWTPVDWFHNGLDSFFYAHLYRFIGHVLFEMGILSQPEPIRHYYGHDAVLTAGKKMSKHHGNVVSPDEILRGMGADVLRIHVLWAARPLKSIEWSDVNIERAKCLLEAVWNLVESQAALIRQAAAGADCRILKPRSHPLEDSIARTIQRVTFFLEHYRYNACLEEIHCLLKQLSVFAKEDVDVSGVQEETRQLIDDGVRILLLILAPFAPHLCEELWERIGGEDLVATTPWPTIRSGSVIEEGRAVSKAE